MMMRVPMGALRFDDSITKQKVRPGTTRRIIPYAKRYRWMLGLLLFVTALDAAISVASPLLLAVLIDDGIVPRRIGVLIALSLIVTGLALVDAAAGYLRNLVVGPHRARARA